MKSITATADQIVDAITPVINSCLVHSHRSIPRELLIAAIEGMNEPCQRCGGRGLLTVKLTPSSKYWLEGVFRCPDCKRA